MNLFAGGLNCNLPSNKLLTTQVNGAGGWEENRGEGGSGGRRLVGVPAQAGGGGGGGGGGMLELIKLQPR